MSKRLENVIKRVKRLLALANNTPYPGEAQTAHELAQMLITKYQISEASFIDFNDFTDVISQNVPTPAPYELDKAILLNAIAKENYCRVLHGDGYCLIHGYASDVHLCLALYETLVEHMVSDMRSKRASIDTDTKGWSKSFFAGYTVTIAERLRQGKHKVIKGGSNIAVLMREKEHAIARYWEETNGGDKSTTKRVRSDHDGYRQGVYSATNANLNKDNE